MSAKSAVFVQILHCLKNGEGGFGPKEKNSVDWNDSRGLYLKSHPAFQCLLF